MKKAEPSTLSAIPVANHAASPPRSEKAQSFLLHLSDALRPLTDPIEIQERAAQLLGEHLQASRCYYVEYDAEARIATVARDFVADDSPSLVGKYGYDVYRGVLERISNGRTWIVTDVTAAPELPPGERDVLAGQGVVAWIDVPIVKEGTLVAVLCLVQGAPRQWTDAEVALVEDIAERTWGAVERARSETALLASQEQLKRDLEKAKALQTVSTELIPEQHPETFFSRVLDAATSLMEADAASIQMLDERSGRLRLLAWKSFHPKSAEHWQWVDAGSGTTCGQALAKRQRVVVGDVETCDFMAGTQDMEEYRRSGLRAIQSTPLVSRSGAILGMISTHWRRQHVPSDGDFHLFDVLTRQAADMMERSRTEAALCESQQRLRHIIDGAREYAIIALDHERKIRNWNVGAERLLGYAEGEVLGQSGDIFFTPEDRAAGVPEKELQIALAEGRASNERWHLRKDGSRFWGSGVMLPIEDEGGSLVLKIFRDRTEEREAENRQQILIHELNHRVKNTLATVQAMASQTLRNSKVESDVRHGFEARLHALAAGHDILTRESWGGADLRRIVAAALKPFRETDDESRINVEGPALYLAPKIALAFTMALHELATNATKYGALSQGGQVDVNWRIEGDRLLFRWRESGGPPVAEPTRKGFGSRLIERSLASELGATVRIEYPTQGVICTIEAPTAQLWAASAMKASQ
jgi:PAS domain S-box-containing protein